MRPKEIVLAWVEAFNRADANALAALYTEEAVNHQVPESPVQGRDAIREMFEKGFDAFQMTRIVKSALTSGAKPCGQRR